MENTLIIIPTYNEIENIQPIIEAVFENNLPLDVLVVDDQSPDGTADRVIQMMKIFPKQLFLESRVDKKGLGAAYVHGFNWALERDYHSFLKWMRISPMTLKNLDLCCLS